MADLSERSQAILSAIRTAPGKAHEISLRTGIPIRAVHVRLNSLEQSGRIWRESNGRAYVTGQTRSGLWPAIETELYGLPAPRHPRPRRRKDPTPGKIPQPKPTPKPSRPVTPPKRPAPAPIRSISPTRPVAPTPRAQPPRPVVTPRRIRLSADERQRRAVAAANAELATIDQQDRERRELLLELRRRRIA